MEAIRDTVNVVMLALKAGKGNTAQDKIEACLKKVLTKRQLKHIKVNYFKQGVLGFKVESSSWLYQMNLEKEALLAGLNKECPQVKSLRFSIGDVKEDEQRQSARKR